MVKNFILKFGSTLIDVAVCLALVAAVISGISAMMYNFFVGLMTLLISVASIAVGAFMIYIIIDIRDRLADIYTLQLEQNALAKANQEKKADAE